MVRICCDNLRAITKVDRAGRNDAVTQGDTDRRELHGDTRYRAVGNYDKPHPPKGFIELYEHGNPVRFRNIWIRPVKAAE